MDRASRAKRDDEIVKLYASGLGLVPIARRFGLADETIRRTLIRRGVQRRHRSPPIPFDPAVTVDDYRSGLTVGDVAKKHHRSPRTIAKAVREAGILPTAGRRDRLDAAEIVRRYQAFESTAEVAAAMGCSESWVRRVLDRAGVERRPWGRPRSKRSP